MGLAVVVVDVVVLWAAEERPRLGERILYAISIVNPISV